MKVLVTGGSGFIGTEVVEALRRRGISVVNYDIKPPRRRDHDDSWMAGNILDLDRLTSIFSSVKPDGLIHLAAHAEITSSAWEDFASIHEGTANLLTAIEGCPSVKRLANISTQLVVGPGHRPRSVLDFRPYTIYGEAKAYAESLLLRWQGSPAWLTVRPAIIWGPHHPSFGDSIWKFIRKGVYLQPASKSPVLRSYGYVENAAEQIVSLHLHHPAETNRQIYYAADAVIDSALWVDGFAKALTGRPAKRIPIAALKGLGLAGDLLLKVGVRGPIDTGRAMRMTQNYPVPVEPTLALTGPSAVSLEEGFIRTVRWLETLETISGAA